MDDLPTIAGVEPPEFEPLSASAAELTSGQSIGRYVLIKQVGSGGMGVVYSAYDSDLDRKVAIKLLQQQPGLGVEQPYARMVREAQALARLAHPNVVAVFEVGEWTGGPYVVMEFIDGPTLGAWCSTGQRSWRKTLEICVQAGRGLAAAHRRDIIHRDFKPHNVLIGAEGRARVVDFGLARALGDPPDRAHEGTETPDPIVSTRLTQTGVIAGTPPYLAPEQFWGEAPDPRTDQYAFCVTVWEALYGQRPFHGDTYDELETNVCAGDIVEPPRRDVPAHLQRVLRRGFARDRERRFPSMDALLDAIERDPWRVRRRYMAGGAAIASVAALSAALARQAETPAEAVDPCDDGPQLLASAWDEEREQSVRAAFGRIEAEFAATSLRTVTLGLDDYTQRWLTEYRDACEATRVDHEQSEALLELRMACLERKRGALEAMTSLMTDADRDVVARSIPAVLALPSPADCARTQTLLARNAVEAPDASRLDQIEQHHEQLERARALGLTGQADEGLTMAQEVYASANAMEHGPLKAEAALMVGILAEEAGQPQLAADQLATAVEEAIASGHDEVLASATVRLIRQVGVRLSRYDDAEQWGRLATAAVRRVGGDCDDALELEANLCSMRSDRADWTSAMPHCNEMLAMATERHGPEHPTTARANRLLSQVMLRAGDYERADVLARRALESFRASHGIDHPDYPIMLSAVAVACHNRGRGAACIPMFEETVDAIRVSRGPDHPTLADAINNLAILMLEHDRLDEAEKHASESLRLRRARSGDDHPGVGAAHRVLASIALARGHLDDALAHSDQAVVITRATRGGDHPDLVDALKSRAEIALALERFEQSIADLRAAHDMGIRLNIPSSGRATLAFELAKVLAAHEPGALDQARSLARQARGNAESAGPDSPLLPKIVAWLQEHPPSRP
ncbi:MAG: serine/threonine-protein kinase [Myxococcota bacterium]